MLSQMRCTVLNTDYSPVSVISAKRGLILVFEGKATIVEEHADVTIRSTHASWPIPRQIVLKTYIRSRATHRVKALLTQRNLFLRDGYKCQYCNRHRSSLKHTEFLTRDHIVPQSQGGRDIWSNVTTACSSCNNKKADQSLETSNMTLIKTPTTPTIFELWARSSQKKSK